MISRVEVELNMNWAAQNPKLFVDAIDKFQDQYANSNWKVSIDMSRKKYVTLTAKYNVGE